MAWKVELEDMFGAVENWVEVDFCFTEVLDLPIIAIVALRFWEGGWDAEYPPASSEQLQT